MAFSSLEELSTDEKCLKNTHIKVCQTFLNVSCSSLLPLKKGTKHDQISGWGIYIYMYIFQPK